MKAGQRKHIRFRAALVGVFLGMALAAIGVRAFYLQVLISRDLSVKAESEYKKSVVSRGERGVIYDRNLRELAVSVRVSSVAAYPEKIQDRKAASRLLARTLDVDRDEAMGKLASKRRFVWIKRKASPRETEALKALNIFGIDFLTEFDRYYPDRSFASQAVGFSGLDGNGLEGIEFYYNRYLKGGAARLTVYRDALGRGIEDAPRASDHRGKDVVLTIDKKIQFISESALREAVERFSAKSGMVVVMAPETGEILAIVNYPGFDPNSFASFGRERWRNRCVTDQFEPGSTMKIFTVAAALESGKSSPDTLVFCHNGRYRVGKSFVHDIKPRAWLSLSQVIKYSSNIGAVKISEIIGPGALSRTLKDFGFGEKTGVDFPGESPGMISPHRTWTRIDAGAIAFGQGISVSAIQMAAAVSAIGNGGDLMRPRVVKGIMDPDGRYVRRFRPERVRRAVSPKTAAAIRKMMARVTAPGGTGVRASLGRRAVCGKTGTAQKPDETGGYSDDRHIASFVGFAPASNPAIAVVVIIDEPRGEHYGGVVAAPVFRKIAGQTLDYLDAYPDRKSPDLRASGKDEAGA
ncbi:Cell division protein FtsI [Candidatus Desulfarcum epimagneticum]|uniref:Cell division protein FtsI n=1 Tax=uncultured Desulfobacteraceae bacterium TaxID=218296 RepID=A0A484HM31_9BACT|nr:Cell division protein FtsI [uncultured Desulfobacteraceae bacterium]